MNPQEEFEAILNANFYKGEVDELFPKFQVIELMQASYNLAIKQAAEAAKIKCIRGYDKVDKQSILNLLIK